MKKNLYRFIVCHCFVKRVRSGKDERPATSCAAMAIYTSPTLVNRGLRPGQAFAVTGNRLI